MRTPWGKGREIEAALGISFSPGVVLVVDSRFSAGGRPQTDVGAKLWVLSSGVVGIFAGRVVHGEKGLDRAKQRFRGATPASVSQAASVIEEALTSAVAAGSRRGPSNECYLLVGVSSLDGDAAIVRFESARDFKPELTCEDQFIGQERLGDEIYQRLRGKAKLAFRGEPLAEGLLIVTEPSGMLLPLAASLDDLVTAKIDGTVGGRPQSFYVQSGKTHSMAAYAQSATGSFEKRTAGYDEVHPVNSRLARRRLAGFRR